MAGQTTFVDAARSSFAFHASRETGGFARQESGDKGKQEARLVQTAAWREACQRASFGRPGKGSCERRETGGFPSRGTAS